MRSIAISVTLSGNVSYNFLIGGDGNVYEGHGFRYQGEAASSSFGSSFDDVGISVAFIGTFTNLAPSEIQIKTFFGFVDDAVKRELIKPEHQVFARDQLVPTDTPAVKLIEKIKTWDSFHEGEAFDRSFQKLSIIFLSFQFSRSIADLNGEQRNLEMIIKSIISRIPHKE